MTICKTSNGVIETLAEIKPKKILFNRTSFQNDECIDIPTALLKRVFLKRALRRTLVGFTLSVS